jgi:hypothetical protein
VWQCLSEWGNYDYHGVADDEHTGMTLPPRCPNCGQAGEVPDGPRYDRLEDLEGRIGDLTTTMAADFEPSEKRDTMFAELRKLNAEHDGLAKTLLGTKFLTAEERERVKRCVAHFLIGPVPGAIQADVAYSILDALGDDHLVELDVMVHAYEVDTSVN